MTKFTIEVELRCSPLRKDVKATTALAELTRSFALEGLPDKTCSMRVGRSRITVVIPRPVVPDQEMTDMRLEVLAPFRESRAVLP